jgi:hypothetical protein
MDFSIGVLVGMQGSMNNAFSFFLLEERETAAALVKIEDFLSCRIFSSLPSHQIFFINEQSFTVE